MKNFTNFGKKKAGKAKNMAKIVTLPTGLNGKQ
jgi:hypothetical protein